METAALAAAVVVALALAALAIRAYFLVGRLHRLVDQIGRLVEEDVSASLRTIDKLAEGIQQATGKVEQGLGSLANTLDRVDRITQKLEPDSLLSRVITPRISKVASWLGGVRKGTASVRRQTPPEERPEQ